jgi:D-arabinose 1-dehydrogenase-like Zn-dependent alcohol dehydrogenase
MQGNIASIEGACDTLHFSSEYQVQPIVEHFDFEDFPKALHRAEKEGPKYRCVINVHDWAKKNGFDK